jgi:hypothetical protein
MSGALVLATRLIRFHPQLSAKGAATPYVAELKALSAEHWNDQVRASASE